MAIEINDDFVEDWSSKYRRAMSPVETELFSEIGPACRQRGHLTKAEFVRIGTWKTRRKSKILDTVPDDVVEQVTRAAFAAEEERISILSALPGVAEGRGSTILTIWNPERYTITDWRAIESLQEGGYFSDWITDPPYGAYLGVCREIASGLRLHEVDVSPLRELDRALWQFSETQS